MGIKLKNMDEGHPSRKWIIEFGHTASSGEYFVNVPYPCKYDKLVFAGGAASANISVGISNINTTDAILADGTVINSASNGDFAAGAIYEYSATSVWNITANSILRIDWTASTADGALALYFTIDDNKIL